MMGSVQLLMKAMWGSMVLLFDVSVCELSGTNVPFGDHGRSVVGEIVIATLADSARASGFPTLL